MPAVAEYSGSNRNTYAVRQDERAFLDCHAMLGIVHGSYRAVGIHENDTLVPSGAVPAPDALH
jgi:hypothetical protein